MSTDATDDVTDLLVQMQHDAAELAVDQYAKLTQPLHDSGMTAEQIAVALELAATVAYEHRQAHEAWVEEAFTRLGMERAKDGKRWVWRKDVAAND